MRAGDIVVNARVLSFAALTAVIVGLVFGVVPALRAGRRSRLDSLRDGTRSSAAGSRRRTMRTLIVGEVALALMLATGTGLVLRSFWRLRREPGIPARGRVDVRRGGAGCDL
jgi:hypothetical protein